MVQTRNMSTDAVASRQIMSDEADDNYNMPIWNLIS